LFVQKLIKMNNMENIISAIDIGTTKIVAVIGKKEADGKYKILGIGNAKSSGVKRGNVYNIEETVEGINNAVKMAELQANIKINDVFVGIAGQNIKCIINSGYINRPNCELEITQAEIDKLEEEQYHIALEPGEEIIHVIPQSFTVDNEFFHSPIGTSGNRLEGKFHVIIGKSLNIRNLKRCVEKAGLNLIKLFLEPIASSKATVTGDEKEAGVAMIDIGGGTSDLAIYYENSLCFTAVVPFGGNVLTADIKQAYGLLENSAEEIKLSAGSTLPESISKDEIITVPGISGRAAKEISRKQLANIIEARMSEIVSIIQYQINNSGYADKLGAGIVLTGGGSLLQCITQFCSFKTGYEGRIGQPIIYLNNEIVKNINSPVFATAIGLIILGDEYYIKNNIITNNIIIKENPEFEEKTVKAKSKPDDFGFADEFAESKKKKKEPKPEKQPKDPKKSPFNKIINGLTNLFDEKDTNMN